MTKQGKTPWIVTGGRMGGLEVAGVAPMGQCLRCGRVLRLKLPMLLDAVVLYMKAFVSEHSACKEPPDAP